MRIVTLLLMLAVTLTITGCTSSLLKTSKPGSLYNKAPAENTALPNEEEAKTSASKSRQNDQEIAINILREIKTLATAGKIKELYEFFHADFSEGVTFEEFKEFINDPETQAKFADLDIDNTKVTYWDPYIDAVKFQATDDDIGVDVLLVVNEENILEPLQFRIFTLY